MNRILARTGGNELKELTEMNRILSSNTNRSSDENDNAVLRSRRLNIRGLDLVLDLTEPRELLDNILGTLEWLSLKSHHRLGSLQNGTK
jgi:hypothetical protein